MEEEIKELLVYCSEDELISLQAYIAGLLGNIKRRKELIKQLKDNGTNK